MRFRGDFLPVRKRGLLGQMTGAKARCHLGFSGQGWGLPSPMHGARRAEPPPEAVLDPGSPLLLLNRQGEARVPAQPRPEAGAPTGVLDFRVGGHLRER